MNLNAKNQLSLNEMKWTYQQAAPQRLMAYEYNEFEGLIKNRAPELSNYSINLQQLTGENYKILINMDIDLIDLKEPEPEIEFITQNKKTRNS
jgi:hypothetical protein